MSEDLESLDALDEMVDSEDRIASLQAANARLVRQLSRAKISKEDLVEAVYRAVNDNMPALIFPKILPFKPSKTIGDPEVAVACAGDWQLAKVTKSYSSDVCEERIELYADKVMRLTDIQRKDHPVDELRVWLLGDLLEGELIFPGQAHLIDSSLYRQVSVDGPRILGNFLRRMAGSFKTVRVVGVIGNHGRIGGRASKDMNPEANGDRMIYRNVANIFEASGQNNVSFEIPDGDKARNWYAIDSIGTYRTLLFHGDQIRGGGFAGFPFYGAAKRIWGWRTGAIPEPFQDAMCGHWHQNVTQTLNKTMFRVNGTPESDNQYAQEELAATGRPSQRLMFVKPDFGPTSEYIVWLDQEQEVASVVETDDDAKIIDLIQRMNPQRLAELLREGAA